MPGDVGRDHLPLQVYELLANTSELRFARSVVAKCEFLGVELLLRLARRPDQRADADDNADADNDGFGDPATATPAQRGSTLYASTCVFCHGPNRLGNPPLYPPLKNLVRSDKEICELLRSGQGIMPAFDTFSGDQINDLTGERAETELDILEKCLGRLNVPYYGVTGNHDAWEPEEKWPYIERGFTERFAFGHGNSYFVGLNSSWLRGCFEGDYHEREIAYMTEQFAKAPADCRHRFVVTHWPLFVEHPDEEDTYWNMPKRKDVVAAFKENNVSCVLSGHYHQDIDAIWHGVPLITSVGVCWSLQYPEVLSFRIVTVFPDGWSVRRSSVEYRTFDEARERRKNLQ